MKCRDYDATDEKCGLNGKASDFMANPFGIMSYPSVPSESNCPVASTGLPNQDIRSLVGLCVVPLSQVVAHFPPLGDAIWADEAQNAALPICPRSSGRPNLRQAIPGITDSDGRRSSPELAGLRPPCW